MKVRKEITELLNAGIITTEVADRINAYYESKYEPSSNKLVIVFGILGAILVSLGIILILAHNWDSLSRAVKTVIAFIPLVAGQLICGFTLLKKEDSVAWREAGSSFLFFSVGACISLIGQIYNVPGNLGSFLFTWMLLCVPIIYVMRSSMASLLYIAGITWYACELSYWGNSTHESFMYWGMLLLALPYYYLLFRKQKESNFFTFHNWFIPLSVITMLGTFARDTEELMFIAYVSLFGLLYLIGNTPFIREQKIRNNGYLVLGSLGTVVILLILSFNFFWKDLIDETFSDTDVFSSPEFIVSAFLTLASLALLVYQKIKYKSWEIKPVENIFILFIIIFLIGLSSPFAQVLINVLVLGVGIQTIREGAKQNHLGILNYGLLIVTALVICRFFDTDISFVLKGILFVAVGLGFFFANYLMMKKKRETSVVNRES
ncbi:MAG TPA: DUF2157 domain-containing protein [Saprospiraceae bacterium]|nr:DUF2157 domain-containing protein [Saprospiraceae bacterium]